MMLSGVMLLQTGSTVLQLSPYLKPGYGLACILSRRLLKHAKAQVSRLATYDQDEGFSSETHTPTLNFKPIPRNPKPETGISPGLRRSSLDALRA